MTGTEVNSPPAMVTPACPGTALSRDNPVVSCARRVEFHPVSTLLALLLRCYRHGRCYCFRDLFWDGALASASHRPGCSVWKLHTQRIRLKPQL
eukprot:364100-Chlamydomonas_euryale.AAC.62